VNSIICFSGLPQTGKTTLSRRLALELRCKFVSFGDFVRQEALKRGIVNATRRDLQDLGQDLVKENVSEFCHEVLGTVQFSPGEQIVIDGIRHKEVLEVISKISRNQPMKVIYLTASERTRKRRTPRHHDLASIDSHEVESEVEADIRGLADIVIETENDEGESFRLLFNWIHSASNVEALRKNNQG
jgi:cytidylate kinase